MLAPLRPKHNSHWSLDLNIFSLGNEIGFELIAVCFATQYALRVRTELPSYQHLTSSRCITSH